TMWRAPGAAGTGRSPRTLRASCRDWAVAVRRPQHTRRVPPWQRAHRGLVNPCRPPWRATMAESTRIARTRQVTWDDPIATAKAGHGMAGLDFLRAMMDGKIPPPPICFTLGFILSEVSEGVAVF